MGGDRLLKQNNTKRNLRMVSIVGMNQHEDWMDGASGDRLLENNTKSNLRMMSPMSFRYWRAIDSLQKRYIRKNLFGAPSSLSIQRPNDNLGTYWHLRNRSSYSDVMCMTISTIIFYEQNHNKHGTAHER